MNEILLNIDFELGKTYQYQIREKLIRLIYMDQFGTGVLPSSRKMAKQLGVSRNTVMHVYESLVQEGYLISRERSGFYVNTEIIKESNIDLIQNDRSTNNPAPNWSDRLSIEPSKFITIIKDRAWMEYEHPFIYGKIDPNDFPINQWRECVRISHIRKYLHEWVGGYIDDDDPELIDQIRQQILTKRGIAANSDELLITMGTLNSFFLLSSLLSKKGTIIGIEDPGWPDLHNTFNLAQAKTKAIKVDNEGIVIDDSLRNCDYVCVTPSHHYPTTITMSMERRYALLAEAEANDFIIIEDDYDSEINFSNTVLPALKSLDINGRVIYTGSLSKSISPGLRIGYLVADKELIKELRALRRINYRYPPSNNQRAIAIFISQGYYDSYGRRMRRIFKKKWDLMDSCLKQHFKGCNIQGVYGSFCFWVELPNQLNSKFLIEEAAKISILIESGDTLFASPNAPSHFIRIGYSAIPIEKIELGIVKLGALINTLSKY